MKKFMRALAGVVAVGLIWFLVAYVNGHSMGVFNPQGVIALAERNLIVTALSLMLIVVIPVFILLGTFVWRYRAGNTKAKYTPDWHSNTILEILWWSIPSAIILTLAIITWNSTHALDPYKPLDSSVKPITIEVVALDWKWLFIYPEQGIATVNFVEIPKGTPVNFKITADAPMNSFWIPELGGQIYAMPGMSSQLHLMANEEGSHAGLSSNFSGDGFSGMKFIAKVESQENFDQWVKTARISPLSLSIVGYGELAKQSENNPVAYYGSVDANLYDTIIRKFMVPATASASSSSTMMSAMEGMSTN